MQNALNITQILKNTRKTIVATIHQPPSKILDLFDDIIIINNSHIVYHNTYDNFIPYFQILGYTFPQYTNPTEILFTEILPRLESKDCIFDPSKLSDKFNEYKENRDIHENNINTNQHIPELINKEKIFEITEHPDSNRINDKEIIKTNKEYINSNEFSTTTNVSENNKYKSLMIKNKKSTEIGMLLLRFFYSTIRNKNILLSKFLQCVGIVFIIGSIFYNIPGLNSNSEIITKNGFLYFLVMYVYFGAAMGCVHLFFIDLKLLRREYSNNYYSIISYFISRLITDTILNSVFVIITALSLFLISRAYRTGWVLTVQLFNMWSLSMVGYAWGIFVSSICMDLSSALVILPCVLLPLTIVSGLFLVPSGMVIFLRWLQYISPSRYSYNIAMKMEYGDKIVGAVPGDTFTGFFGISISFLILFAMYLVLMGFSFLGLRMKVRKYV
ncbi:ABC transporter protein [Spraguea lophii 42_110]|uniref:ABC transporter protein n=1 Tax=Spraguea lophii (strain 42_110) TaxID=1358809 RepID=S7W9H3_SPRLO|nr:ABC transporter protein [Spraguea lophii 42_110]